MPGDGRVGDQVQAYKLNTAEKGKLALKPQGRMSRTSMRSSNNLQEEKTKCQEIEASIISLFDGKVMMIIMTIATFLALFGDDIRLAEAAKSADDAFFAIFLVCLILFAVEFIAFCIARPGYIFSFFFWLDLVAVLSLVPDIPWIWDPIFEGFGGDLDATGSQDLSVARAGRASRAGTKAGRLVRFLRVVRLMRVVKIYKYCRKKKPEDEEEEKEMFDEDVQGSNIGQALNEFTSRRVIMGVLAMLFVFPLLTVPVSEDSSSFRLQQLSTYGEQTVTVPTPVYNAEVQSYIDDYTPALVYLRATNPSSPSAFVRHYDEDRYEALRTSELIKLQVNEDYQAWFDNREETQTTAQFGAIMTFFVLVLLGVGSWAFTKDINKAVVVPIERMTSFVTALSNNPLGKISMRGGEEDKKMETSMLEGTLLRLAGLLQIGFGTAGAEIIAKNMGKGGLNVMIPGKKMVGIFGFCDIRYFGKCTEQLQERVLMFVNQVAECVHERVNMFQGHNNKNIGNVFVLVWKFPKPGAGVRPDEIRLGRLKTTVGEKAKSKTPRQKDIASLEYLWNDPEQQKLMIKMADQALTSFLYVISEIATSPVFKLWREDPALVREKFKLSMGFGLHTGWAIEGAIGSTHKIDASYLSPNVNMAARLEAATKQYSVPLLFSGPFYELLQPAIQERCRLLDQVTVKGSQLPIKIYTFDVKSSDEHLQQLLERKTAAFDLMAAAAETTHGPAAEPEKTGKLQAMRAKLKRTKPKAEERESSESEDVKFAKKLDKEAFRLDLVAQLQRGVPEGFVAMFNEASNLYIEGNWQQSKEILLQASKLVPNDGPTNVLMRVMGKTNFSKPGGWQGFRALTSK